MVKKTKIKPVAEPQSATIFSREIYERIQAWRGDIRLDEWHEHFLSSLAHLFWVHENAIYLSQKQAEKLEEIAEIIAGYAPPSRPLHPDDIEGEIVDWANEGGRLEREHKPSDDHWQHAQRSAKRRISAGAPLASNLWWEKRHVV